MKVAMGRLALRRAQSLQGALSSNNAFAPQVLGCLACLTTILSRDSASVSIENQIHPSCLSSTTEDILVRCHRPQAYLDHRKHVIGGKGDGRFSLSAQNITPGPKQAVMSVLPPNAGGKKKGWKTRGIKNGGFQKKVGEIRERMGIAFGEMISRHFPREQENVYLVYQPLIQVHI